MPTGPRDHLKGKEKKQGGKKVMFDNDDDRAIIIYIYISLLLIERVKFI